MSLQHLLWPHSRGAKLLYKFILGAANTQPRKCFVWCFYSEKNLSRKHIVILHSRTAVLCGTVRFSDSNITLFYFKWVSERYPPAPPCNHIFRWPDIHTLRRVSRLLWRSLRGWFCQHHNKSPWLSRPCFSRLSSCPGCLASAVGRKKTDLTLTTPEKVGLKLQVLILSVLTKGYTYSLFLYSRNVTVNLNVFLCTVVKQI